jgi:hypothetical protein
MTEDLEGLLLGLSQRPKRQGEEGKEVSLSECAAKIRDHNWGSRHTPDGLGIVLKPDKEGRYEMTIVRVSTDRFLVQIRSREMERMLLELPQRGKGQDDKGEEISLSECKGRSKIVARGGAKT